MENTPSRHWLGENERLLGPGFREVLRAKVVVNSSYLVSCGDVGHEWCQINMSTIEWTIQNVGIETDAEYGGHFVIPEAQERGTPRTTPVEVCRRRPVERP